MFDTHESPIIISIGGSLIAPNQIDVNFLSHLNTFIRKYIAQGKRFFLTSGGGKTCRNYLEAARTVSPQVKAEDADWLGIHATRLNGHLLRTIFADIAHPRMIENYEHKLEDWKEPLVIGAGWNPGHSTDYVGVVLARDYGAHLLIKLTSSQVYNKDPKIDPSAKPLTHITWEEYQKIIGTTWKPGLNTPFDPIATQLASKLDLKVVIVEGKNWENVECVVEGRSFEGTTIEP